MSKLPTVLFLDDEPINVEIFVFNFQDELNIITANSGAEGLKLLDGHNHINIVISDLNMPGMDGIAFVENARKKHPKLHYIILTGFQQDKKIEAALAKGIIHKYFGKPFDVEELLTYLQNIR